MHYLRLAPLVLPALLFVLTGTLPAAQANGYDDALDGLKRASKRRALGPQVRAYDELGATGDARALTTLAKLYAAPRAPKAQQRAALVSTIARHFDGSAHTAALEALRLKHASAADAWLWYRTLIIQGRHAGLEGVHAAIQDVELPGDLRAAAVEAAVTLDDGALADLAPGLLAALPEDAGPRALIVQSLAAGLHGVRHRTSNEAMAKASDALIDYLATGKASAATKVVVGRMLQELLDSRFAYLDGAAWKKHKTHPGATRDSDAARLLRARCAGKKTEGSAIAYLIDVSMRAQKEVGPEEMDRFLDTKSHVGTRLGLMTHAVRESIRELKPEQSFIVIPYTHHGLGVLPGAGQLLPGMHDNKLKVFEAMRTLAATGEADLHAGLAAVQAAHPGGMAKEAGPEAVLAGVDTVFLFNQSVSHYDRWVAQEASRRVDKPRTTASGRMVCGTYAEPSWLMEELARWRMRRKLRIVPIAFGDADAALLKQVARVADGFLARRGQAPEASTEIDLGPEDEAYRKARSAYITYLKRPSLNRRTVGRSRFAATGHLRALDALARDYARAEKPVPEVQQLIVDTAYEAYREPNALPLFARWRARHTERHDAWLWHRALAASRASDEVDPPRRAAGEAHDPFLRAAAIRALAKQQDEKVLGLIPGWVSDLLAAKDRGVAFTVPIEAMATALQEMSMSKDEEPYKAAGLALLGVFDDEKTPKRTKLTIVRNLASGLEVPPDGLDKNAWVREVRAGGSGAGMRDSHYGAPTFGGLRASGTRICYVIDMSDSMLTPLKPNERMKPRVITGQTKKRKRRVEDEIDWTKLKTRFDLARALLITSLQGLRPNTHFCVVWFGSEAGTLKSTKGMKPSTPANISRTVKELRKIKAGAPGAGKHKTGVKWGSLRGETNLHGGLHRAFTRTEGKPLQGFTYVSEEGLHKGCDTIFVLSDGAPSTDDFVTLDKRDPEDHVVEDRETMKRAKDVPEVNYPGPYSEVRQSQNLYYDIERHNLIRQVEIHCLGIGEANMGSLGQIARIGLGEARRIGEDD